MWNEKKRSRTWIQKIRGAFRGVQAGVRGESSFYVHFFMTVLVVLAAAVLETTRTDWCLLALCITVVLTAEMFNSALERLAKAITRKQSIHVAYALDIGSAAVLVASMGAVLVGGIIFGYRLGVMFGWWA